MVKPEETSSSDPNPFSRASAVGYQGSSPDEVALLEFAQRHEFEFLAGTDETIVVKVRGTKKTYELVRKIEFTSDRKRASVIVKLDQ